MGDRLRPLKTKKGVLSIPSKSLKDILSHQGAESFQFIPLMAPTSYEHYKNWLSEKKQGQMRYMAQNAHVRKSPHQHFAPMQSMIMFTTAYYPHPQVSEKGPKHLKQAHYARNKDYHLWFRGQLKEWIKTLEAHFPQEQFMAFTDAVPLLERDHAVQAGLGWVGKNTCLIHPKKGSLFFIGEILTTLPCHEEVSPIHDLCGHCTACMDHCPTGALESPKRLDANRCIAHWNIESREVPPLELREKMGDWFFGCDICQTVCPWNLKLHKAEKDFHPPPPDRSQMVADLKWILTSSNKQLMKELRETPLTRAGGRGLKRNALLVTGNMGLGELKDQVTPFLSHPKLGELAQWTLNQISDSIKSPIKN